MNNIQHLSKLITEIKNPSTTLNAVSILKAIELFTGFCLYLVCDALHVKQKTFQITSGIFDSNIIANMPENEIDKYSKAADAAYQYVHIIKHKEAFTDVLSELYEEIYLTGKCGDGLGQFLTPDDVSSLIASLGIRSRADTAKINEECCGAGSIVLSTLKELHQKNGSHLDTTLNLNDIDPLMVKMAIIQVMAPIAFKENVDINEVNIFNQNSILNKTNQVFKYISG
ncbi:N-6 DNA methylase [Klebsiella pneumoniae]